MPEKILGILRACTQFNRAPEYGVEGDLSYGRPSADALVNMLERWAKRGIDGGRKLTRMNTYARAKALEVKAKTASQEFISSQSSAFDDSVRALPQHALEAVLDLFYTFIADRMQSTVTAGSMKTKSTVHIKQAQEALQLAAEARSLEEFLNLLRLGRFQPEITKMGLGTTLDEIAETCVKNDSDADTFMKSIDTLSRPQANRLAKISQEKPREEDGEPHQERY